MRQWKLWVLHEHGEDGAPYGCSYIRLLRPLTHPLLRDVVTVQSGTAYAGQPVDAVIVDRRWRPDIALALAEALLETVHRAGARLLYALDDNFFELAQENKDWSPTQAVLQAVDFFLRQADGVLVTTPPLKERFSTYNARITVVPNMLDERLLSARRKTLPGQFLLRSVRWLKRQIQRQPMVIGYMGTRTHDDDLLMILPALRAVSQRHRDKIGFEMIGVMARPETLGAMAGLPVRYIDPGGEHTAYPAFINWFSKVVWWDIALAPLQDSAFNGYKSDIKFLDYAAIAAAGVFSRVPAYTDTVQHRHNGLLVENTVAAWEFALEELLSKPRWRLGLGLQAAHYLRARRTVARSRQYWVDAMETLLA
jgi:processive 1,2-diacylglycerol beta-glucosyltransferase